MYSAESVETAVRELYFTGVAVDLYTKGEVEHLLYGIDFLALAQTIRHKAETVYAYTAQSERPKSLNYRAGNCSISGPPCCTRTLTSAFPKW